jgi:hypothetical protein
MDDVTHIYFTKDKEGNRVGANIYIPKRVTKNLSHISNGEDIDVTYIQKTNQLILTPKNAKL